MRINRIFLPDVSMFAVLDMWCKKADVWSSFSVFMLVWLEMLSFPVEFKNCCLGFSRRWEDNRRSMNLRGKKTDAVFFSHFAKAALFLPFWQFYSLPTDLCSTMSLYPRISKSVFVYHTHRQLRQLWPWGWHNFIPEWVRSHRHLGPRTRTTCQDFCLIDIWAAVQEAKKRIKSADKVGDNLEHCQFETVGVCTHWDSEWQDQERTIS